MAHHIPILLSTLCSAWTYWLLIPRSFSPCDKPLYCSARTHASLAVLSSFWFFSLPLPPLCVLTYRASNVAALVVTESMRCFIVSLSSLISLLFPPAVTSLAAYSVDLVRMVCPSTLASSSRIPYACVCAFSSSAAAYSITAAKLPSSVMVPIHSKVF